MAVDVHLWVLVQYRGRNLRIVWFRQAPIEDPRFFLLWNQQIDAVGAQYLIETDGDGLHLLEIGIRKVVLDGHRAQIDNMISRSMCIAGFVESDVTIGTESKYDGTWRSDLIEEGIESVCFRLVICRLFDGVDSVRGDLERFKNLSVERFPETFGFRRRGDVLIELQISELLPQPGRIRIILDELVEHFRRSAGGDTDQILWLEMVEQILT